MLAKRIISLDKQIVRGECKRSRSQGPCGSHQQSLQRTQVGSVHTSAISGPSQAGNCKINGELASCMAFESGDEHAHSPTALLVTQKERMLTLLLRLTSVGNKGASSSRQLTVPTSWTLAQLKQHLLSQMTDGTTSSPHPTMLTTEDVSLTLHDRPLHQKALGSVKLCEVSGLEPYTVITCQIGR